ncbi:MAG TPA: putative toxin-antitoxin system toxin component, PIN family [Tepidisphaeraceae bacterium]|nr:putative toxin-antitoxin system toxin component, PIN family [Tepidisphaeraceae bacterium]
MRIVFDTNTLLRSLVVGPSAAATVRRAAERRAFITLLSKPVLDEYRAVLTNEQIVGRFPEITPELVEITIRRLRFLGEYLRSPTSQFPYQRDPGDSKFIELAIDLRATHILSFDKDLLSLPRNRGDAGRRFRQRLRGAEVVDAGEFLRKHGAELNV